MKTFFRVLIGLVILFATLEGVARLYFLSQNKAHLSFIRFNDASAGQWKNLPYKIFLSDGRFTKALRDGTIIMDIPYSIDKFSRRKSLTSTEKTQQFLIFVGCSFTFGSGVQDHETLPSQTQKYLPGFRTYNYGIGGATPQEVLLRLKNISPEELEEPKGRIIYSFFKDHIDRFFWETDFIGTWGSLKNVYEFKDGTFKNFGPYAILHPYKTYFYRMRSQSAFYQLIKDYFRPRYSDDQIREFVNHLKLMDAEAKRISSNSIVFLIWPGTDEIPHLKELIRSESMSLLDYSSVNLHQITAGKDVLPMDGHPTGESYEALGKMIAHDISALSLHTESQR